MNRLKVQLCDLWSVPIVANLYMKHFERKALSTTSIPPEIGLDMWMTHLSLKKKTKKQNFLDHINKTDSAIKFTVVGNQENGAIPFLDTLVKP